jgi:hypothetical protein
MIRICRSNFASTAGGTDRRKKSGVNLAVLLEITWNIIFVVNSFNWADWFAGPTIHALIRLDVEHPVTLIDTVNGTLFDAGLILHIHTRLGDYVGHFNPFKSRLPLTAEK